MVANELGDLSDLSGTVSSAYVSDVGEQNEVDMVDVGDSSGAKDAQVSLHRSEHGSRRSTNGVVCVAPGYRSDLCIEKFVGHGETEQRIHTDVQTRRALVGDFFELARATGLMPNALLTLVEQRHSTLSSFDGIRASNDMSLIVDSILDQEIEDNRTKLWRER